MEALQEGRTVVKFEKCKVLDRKLRPVKPLKRKKAVVIVGPRGGDSSPEQTDGEDHAQDEAAPQGQSYVVVES